MAPEKGIDPPMNAVTASRPHNQLPPPSVGDVFAHPQYWISGAGHDAAHAAECPHGYRLTASCPCCYQGEDPKEYQFTTVELFGLRVMSTRQPWATSLLERGKPVENRTRAISWRGPVVIHAGRKWDDRDRDIAAEMRVPAVPRNAPTGYLGVMDLVGVHRDEGCCRPWGEPGSYHWGFKNPRVFHTPIAGPGHLGMYRKVPLAVAHAVVAEAWTRGGLTRLTRGQVRAPFGVKSATEDTSIGVPEP
ncbi:predicted protein [Streptomyces sp. AA4]|nr:predicted protein [Streptomyces sp. AA4]